MPLILMLIYSALNWEMEELSVWGKQVPPGSLLSPGALQWNASSLHSHIVPRSPPGPQPGQCLSSSSPGSELRALGASLFKQTTVKAHFQTTCLFLLSLIKGLPCARLPAKHACGEEWVSGA